MHQLTLDEKISILILNGWTFWYPQHIKIAPHDAMFMRYPENLTCGIQATEAYKLHIKRTKPKQMSFTF
jgi:hypothetical protein